MIQRRVKISLTQHRIIKPVKKTHQARMSQMVSLMISQRMRIKTQLMISQRMQIRTQLMINQRMQIRIQLMIRNRLKKVKQLLRKMDQIQKIKTRMIQIKIPMVKQMNPANLLNPKKL